MLAHLLCARADLGEEEQLHLVHNALGDIASGSGTIQLCGAPNLRLRLLPNDTWSGELEWNNQDRDAHRQFGSQ
eukprot:8223647-Alexandrium_andersonii.AAC.1